jgi:hypothetical protein
MGPAIKEGFRMGALTGPAAARQAEQPQWRLAAYWLCTAGAAAELGIGRCAGYRG